MMNLGVPLIKTNIYIGYLLQKCLRTTALLENLAEQCRLVEQDSPPPSFPFRKKEVSDATNFLPAVFLCLTPNTMGRVAQHCCVLDSFGVSYSVAFQSHGIIQNCSKCQEVSHTRIQVLTFE